MEYPPLVSRKIVTSAMPHVARSLQYDEPFRQDNALVETSGLPNLTVFAGKVVSQQRFQKEALEDLQELLKQIQKEVEMQKKNYQALSSEKLIWEQKIVLCKETGIQTRNEIGEIKSEVLELIKRKQKLGEDIQAVENEKRKYENQMKNRVSRMEEHIQKIETVESRSEICCKIAKTEEELFDIEAKINQYSKLKDLKFDAVKMKSDMKTLDREKAKLSGILLHKRNQVREEEEKISRKLKEQDVARNKLAAQKLRLRRQIEKSKATRQELRDAADSIRRQIREITG